MANKNSEFAYLSEMKTFFLCISVFVKVKILRESIYRNLEYIKTKNKTEVTKENVEQSHWRKQIYSKCQFKECNKEAPYGFAGGKQNFC